MRHPRWNPKRATILCEIPKGRPLKQMFPDSVRKQMHLYVQIMICPFLQGSPLHMICHLFRAPSSFGAYHAMDSPPPPPPPPPPHQSTSNYYYLVLAVAAVAVLLLVWNVIAVGCCSRCSIIGAIRRILRSRGPLAREIDDEQIGELIPACKYRKEQAQEHECSVCLSVFVDGEDVRQLPRCRHSFHAPCIDMWLYSHSDCPLCRAVVLERPPPRCQTAAGGGGGGGGGGASMQPRPFEPRSTAGLIVALM